MLVFLRLFIRHPLHLCFEGRIGNPFNCKMNSLIREVCVAKFHRCNYLLHYDTAYAFFYIPTHKWERLM